MSILANVKKAIQNEDIQTFSLLLKEEKKFFKLKQWEKVLTTILKNYNKDIFNVAIENMPKSIKKNLLSSKYPLMIKGNENLLNIKDFNLVPIFLSSNEIIHLMAQITKRDGDILLIAL